MRNSRHLSPVRKQVIKFTLIGILAVLVDLACYYTFLNIFPEKMFTWLSNEVWAKTLSFLCGMTVTYSFNKLWTWKQNDRSNKRMAKFGILYSLSLLMNVAVNTGMLFLLFKMDFLEWVPFKYLVAFITATGISAILNFFGQKAWVFK